MCWSSTTNPALLCTGCLSDFKSCSCLLDTAPALSSTCAQLGSSPCWWMCKDRGDPQEHWRSYCSLYCFCLQSRKDQTWLNSQTVAYQRKVHLTAPCRAIHATELFDIPDSQLVRCSAWINYNNVNMPKGVPILLQFRVFAHWSRHRKCFFFFLEA